MAEPIPAPAGGDITGGLFSNLNPKQRRYATVAGIGALLALIVLLGQRKEPPAPAADEDGEEEFIDYVGAGTVPLGTPPFGPGSTFADNGEAAAILGTSVTEGLADVSGALEAQQQEFERATETLAAGQLGQAGINKAQFKALRAAQLQQMRLIKQLRAAARRRGRRRPKKKRRK